MKKKEKKKELSCESKLQFIYNQYRSTPRRYVWYVVAFYFLFFRGREGKRGKACIGSLSKSRIHDFHGECFSLKTKSNGLRSVLNKRRLKALSVEEEHRQTDRQTDRHPIALYNGIKWLIWIILFNTTKLRIVPFENTRKK